MSCLKAATVLPVAAVLALGPSSTGTAFALELFGLKLFEGEEPPEVIDPVTYNLTLNTGTEDDELAEAVKNASQLFQDDDTPVSGDLGLAIKARDDRDRILAALYEKARYGGVVRVTIDGRDIDTLEPDPDFQTNGRVPVTIDVTPGPVFSLGSVRFEGDVTNRDPATYGLTTGAQADSTLIIKAGEQLVRDLKEEGRPLAKLTNRSVVADHASSTVDVVISAQGGPVAPIGEVGVTGTKTVDPQFVETYSRLNGGKPYSPEALTKAADRLRKLGVFSSVTIKEADGLAPDGSIPMTIEVSEGKHRYFGVGAQYSNTDGFGLQGYWGHRNLFGRAESLRIEGSVDRIGEADSIGKLDYSAGIIFAKPGAFGPASTFNASVKASIAEPDAYRAETVTGAAGATFELSEFDTISGGGEVSFSNIEDAFGENRYLTISLPLEYVRDTRDDKLNATEGYRASISTKPSYETYRSTFFGSLEGSVSAYQSLSAEDRIVLAGKLGAGALFGGANLSDIPANRRFYAGGGGSVRGYSFQEIAPRNAAGDILGGRSYLTGSLEARIAVTDTIGVVPFIDAGTVSADTTPDFSDIRMGAGIGLRYATPFGPIRLDFAVPLDRYPGGSSYGIYAGIGQSF